MKTQPSEVEQQSNIPSLVTLDLADIYSLIRAGKAQGDMPLPDPGLQLHQFGGPVPQLTLSRTSPPPLLLQLRPSHETRLPVLVPRLYPTGSQPVATTLRRLDKDTYRVLKAKPHREAQPVELDIPAGLPRFINVATLKAILGAGPRDVAFHKVKGEERWTVCPDSYPVDMEDRTQLFKIREWAILS